MNFWCIFELHFFRVYYFSSKQEACQEMLCEQEVTIIMPGFHPSYLKTVSQQVVRRIWTHFLRLLTLNTAFLVRIIQIHTNFGCLKWLVKMATHQTILYLGCLLDFQHISTSELIFTTHDVSKMVFCINIHRLRYQKKIRTGSYFMNSISSGGFEVLCRVLF